MADAATFEVLYSSYSRDKTRGYYMQEPVANSDGATFTALDDRYAKDKSHVWYSNFETDGGAHAPVATNTVLAGGDPATFVYLDRGYAKDARQVYHRGAVLKGADAASFAMLPAPENGADAKDATGTYLDGKRAPK